MELQDLVEIFQDPSRRNALGCVALFDFQRALLDGLTVLASSGLADRGLDIDPTGTERRRALTRLQEAFGRIEQPTRSYIQPPPSTHRDAHSMALQPSRSDRTRRRAHPYTRPGRTRQIAPQQPWTMDPDTHLQQLPPLLLNLLQMPDDPFYLAEDTGPFSPQDGSSHLDSY